jgi:PAS domain S-box-containing protein
VLLSEERLAEAQRIAHLGNWDWQLETGDMYWSDEIFRIFGHRPGSFEPSYESFLGLVHPLDKPMVNQAVNEAIYEGKPFHVEHRLVLPGGEERVVTGYGEVTRGPDGTPLRMIGTVQDITGRRRAEESLRLMEEKFARAFRNSPDWIVITRAVDGRYIEVNDAMLRLTGYSRDEVIGRSSVELGIWVEPYERTGMLKLLDEHGSMRNLEARFRMKSGEIRTMLWSAELMDYKGEACLIVVAHDVTEKRQLENDLLKSQAKLHQKHAELKTYLARVECARQEWEWTLNCIDQMVILGDRDGRIKRSNRAFQAFVGLSPEQLVGLDWAELLHAYELTTGTIFLRSMELFHRPSGRWYVLNPYQFREGEEGEVAGTVITIHDITELRQMSEQLQQYRDRE